MDILQPKIQEQEPAENTLPGSSPVANQPDLSPLKGYFNTDNPDIDEERALIYINNYFSKNGTESVVQMLTALKEINMRMGMTPLGESRLKATYNYIKVLSQISDLEKTRNAYER
jgi:hypothetical protein